jgi:hypothetical protein
MFAAAIATRTEITKVTAGNGALNSDSKPSGSSEFNN